MLRYDQPAGLERSLDALATARRLGNRAFESVAAANAMHFSVLMGRWEEVDRLDAELTPDDGSERPDAEFVHSQVIEPALLRGDLATARDRLQRCATFRDSAPSSESRLVYEVLEALVIAAGGEPEAAMARLVRTLATADEATGPTGEAAKVGFGHAVDLALRLGRLDDAAALLALDDALLPGEMPPFRRAQHERGTALLAAARGEHDAVEAGLRAALAAFEELGYAYWVAHAQVDLAAWLLDRDRAEEAWPLLDEAEVALTRLGAQPALQRVRELRAPETARL
jgi:hypothetical protein